MGLAYIGLGSNLDQPRQQLERARQALAALPETRLLAQSGVYRSPAMTLPDDPVPQPDYLNAVVKLETDLAPHPLLHSLQGIEAAQGRVRSRTWGPRTLDLDLLMYDDLQLQDAELTIPHPGIAERDFVLLPLSAIDENLVIPGLGTLSGLLASRKHGAIEYLGALHG
jgi:2-amino-4-hydroxy-6-hydroxymethyldihydropteridine diphosphokinase